jgi:hypothetical protein
MRKLNALLTMCFALVLASTVRAQNSGVNNGELKGDYAFSFNGITTGCAGCSAVFAAVGRFTADGAGNVTNGELDTNAVGTQDKLVAQSFTATYAIGADHRGVMTLNVPGGGVLAFAMMANGNAQFIEVDAAGGYGTVGSGTMERVDTTAYSTAKIIGDYALGFAGLDGWNNSTTIAGRLTANGAGAFTNLAADSNKSGDAFGGTAFAVASYTVSDTASGRGMMILPPLLGGAPQNLNFVFYIVNAGKLFTMEVDAVTSLTPLLNGSLLQQHSPVGGFSNASLNGGMVMYLTGQSGCGGTSLSPNVLVGLLTANSNGALTLSYDQNCGGTTTSAAGLLGTYNVAGNGRVSIVVGTEYAYAYMVSSNQVFFVSSAFFGFGEPQAADSLTNSVVQGRYAGSTSIAATIGVVIFSGEFTADGASPTGHMTGIEDIGAPNGWTSGLSLNATYSVFPSPTNGRGTMSVSGSVGNAIAYVVSPSKFVVLSLSDPNPAVLIFEQ